MNCVYCVMDTFRYRLHSSESSRFKSSTRFTFEFESLQIQSRCTLISCLFSPSHFAFSFHFFLAAYNGYCFNGECPTLDRQCEKIWGYGGISADQQCYDQFNTKGSINGHCGKDRNGDYRRCETE